MDVLEFVVDAVGIEDRRVAGAAAALAADDDDDVVVVGADRRSSGSREMRIDCSTRVTASSCSVVVVANP